MSGWDGNNVGGLLLVGRVNKRVMDITRAALWGHEEQEYSWEGNGWGSRKREGRPSKAEGMEARSRVRHPWGPKGPSLRSYTIPEGWLFDKASDHQLNKAFIKFVTELMPNAKGGELCGMKEKCRGRKK